MKQIQILFISSILCLNIPFAFAQTPPPKPAPSKKIIFDIEFKGGSIGELLAQIKKDPLIPKNIIADERAQKATLPPFSLNSISAEDLMFTIEYLSSSQLNIKKNGNLYIIKEYVSLNSRATNLQGPKKYDLNFSGGTLKKFLAETKEKADFNILTTGDLSDIKLPAFSLKSVDLGNIEKILRLLMMNYPNLNIKLVGNTLTLSVLNNRVYHEQICKVFHLGEYLETHKLKDIVTLIDTAWKMVDQDSSPQLKYHEETKLLIVVATKEDLEIVHEILEQLN